VPRTPLSFNRNVRSKPPKNSAKNPTATRYWVAVIVVLVLVIAYLLVQLFAGGGAGSAAEAPPTAYTSAPAPCHGAMRRSSIVVALNDPDRDGFARA
jgi:hypothetical protein